MRFASILALGTCAFAVQAQPPVPKYDVTGAEVIAAKAAFKVSGARATYTDRIALSSNGGTLAVEARVEGKSRTLVYDLKGKEPKLVFEVVGAKPALSPSGKIVGVQPYGNDFVLHDVATKKLLGTVAEGRVGFGGFAGETVAVAVKEDSDDKFKAILWNVTTKKELASFPLEGKIEAAFLDDKGKTLSVVVKGKGFEVAHYDLATKKLVGQAKAVAPAGIPQYSSTPLYAEVSADGATFGGYSPGGYVVHDAKDGKALATIADLGTCPSAVMKGETTLKYATEAMAKAGGVKAGDYVIFNWKTRKVVAVLTGAAGKPIESVAARSADGKTLVILNQSGDCFVFDTSKLK